jgi:sugar lactone lactonase YvrE
MPHAKVQRRKGVNTSSLCAFAPWCEIYARRTHFRLVAALSCILLLANSIAAAADVKVETVLTGLHRPCGIALRPNGTADKYELYVADSAAGRVIKWSNHDRDKITEIIAGFAAAPAQVRSRQTGPLSLFFLDPGLLVVGSSTEGGGALARCFELLDEGKVLSAAQPSSGGNGTGSFPNAASSPAACTSLTRTHPNDAIPDAVVLVVRNPDGTGSLIKARVQAGVLGQLQPFVSSDPSLRFESTGAVATSNSGRIVVAHQQTAASRGSAKTDGGRLTFFNPFDGDKEMELNLDSPAVVGLAYSPITGSLFAADFGAGANAGGIYRLEDASELGKSACRMVKVAGVPKPTALAFAPDGALYVTTFGSGDNDGSIQVLTGDL